MIIVISWQVGLQESAPMGHTVEWQNPTSGPSDVAAPTTPVQASRMDAAAADTLLRLHGMSSPPEAPKLPFYSAGMSPFKFKNWLPPKFVRSFSLSGPQTAMIQTHQLLLNQVKTMEKDPAIQAALMTWACVHMQEDEGEDLAVAFMDITADPRRPDSPALTMKSLLVAYEGTSARIQILACQGRCVPIPPEAQAFIKTVAPTAVFHESKPTNIGNNIAAEPDAVIRLQADETRTVIEWLLPRIATAPLCGGAAIDATGYHAERRSKR